MKHGLLHIFGCLIPILIIFLLPAFGVGAGVSFTIFLVLMMACHLFMMRGHGHDDGNHEAKPSNEKTKMGGM